MDDKTHPFTIVLYDTFTFIIMHNNNIIIIINGGLLFTI